jgi:endonuclease/exonuclease/phosphatase family metal-dependent hydrolase
MSTRHIRRLLAAPLTAACLFGSLATAGAQTTVTLNAPGTQVTDVMIQAGPSAGTNFNTSDSIATRAADNVTDFVRRGLLKFDTETTIASGTSIESAVMTLTIKTAGADATRTIGVYPVTDSFVQEQATWNVRRPGIAWTTPGGDLGALAATVDVANVAGAKVNIDVTGIVQRAVSGATSSRYTRIALADIGAATSGSSREYFSSEAIDPSGRPVLTVVYGGAPAPVSAASTGCGVALDKAALSVGFGQADWSINVTAAATCAWDATSDAAWLVVKSTMPSPAAGNGYAKVRAVANTTSTSKRIGHVTVNGVVYTVTQAGCGTSCTTAPPPATALRVLQYNTHHGGWNTASPSVYDPSAIVDWIVKASPDIISLNEIEVGDSWSLGKDQTVVYQDLLQQRTGLTWYKVYSNRLHATTGLGELILSKYPIVATSDILLSYGRSALDVEITVSGRIVNFTSTHLDNVAQANRLVEIAQMLPWETTFAENRIVAGDFNAGPGTTEIANMKNGGYVETWSAAKTLGTAIGNGITHGVHQIDYIFQSKGAPNLTLKSVQIFNTADAKGIMPSDHNPILAVFDLR